MKKIRIVLTGAILLSSMGLSTNAFATEGGGFPSDAKVNFISGDGPTNPQDPTDPGNEITPENPGTPAGGSLSIDYASSFQFGEQKISTKDKIYYAKLDKFKGGGEEPDEDVNYVQVTDVRGTLAGWKLSASQQGQFKTSDGDILVGAQITVNTADLVAGVKETSMADYTPGEVASSFTLDPDGFDQTVVTAAKNQGPGTWIYRFGDTVERGKSAVELFVPGESVKLAKHYSTKINWTLATVPENAATPEHPTAPENP